MLIVQNLSSARPVELYHQPKARVEYEPARLDAQECHSLLDSDPQRSTREKRRIGYVVDLVIGGMIGAGVLRKKLGNQSASTTVLSSLQSFYWMLFDHGIGLCFIDFSK